MTVTSRRCRGLRARLLPFVALALLGGASGCEEANRSKADDMLEAWRQAGLMPAVFTALEDENLRPGKCQQGKVDGLSVVLCEYADAAAARAAHNTGLGRVGEATGLAMAAGSLLLIVSDAGEADPAGRKINAISATFRDTLAPRKPAAEPGGDTARDEAGEAPGGKDEAGKAPGGKAAGKQK